jgi:hypothetical protein
MGSLPPATALREALEEIVDGKSVKRGRHDLRWESQDVVNAFIQVLQDHGYVLTTVQDVDVCPGERVPAFYVFERTAHFGWIFWEKFSRRKMRKLFGSVVRNAKGGWAIQIPTARATALYANPGLKCEMDLDNPSTI